MDNLTETRSNDIMSKVAPIETFIPDSRGIFTSPEGIWVYTFDGFIKKYQSEIAKFDELKTKPLNLSDFGYVSESRDAIEAFNAEIVQDKLLEISKNYADDANYVKSLSIKET